MNICKGCIYFTKYYGNKDKNGKRSISNYWCVRRNGFLKKYPKECKLRKERE